MSLLDKTILHYKIISKLGEGGMGVVYKAEDTKIKREVAIKFLPRQIAASDEERERFKIEAQAAGALNHNNIATIYAIEESDDETFIVMEYIKGQELKDKIEAGPLPIDDTLNIEIQIAQGLQIAHEAGVVHRDIKSSNIMLTERGDVKIMDFGLAKFGDHTKLTKEGTTLGTVAYMSPEQAKGDDVDQRSDIFSLGVLLYEMLTGQLPFKGDYDQAVTYSILNEEPEPITGLRTGIPLELERIVGKCLEKDASDRYQHGDELLVDLRQCQKSALNAHSSVAQAVTSRKGYASWALFAAAILLMVLVYSLFLNRSGSKEIILGRTKQVTNQSGLELYPTISPDGSMIAYSAGAIGKMHIYVRQIAAGRSIDLTDDIPGNHRWPQWSPDGTHIAYQSGGMIYVLPTLGGIPKRMIENARFTVWSPDGQYFAYVHGTETTGTISIKSVERSESRRIADAYLPHSLSWSRDGKWIAFVSGNDDFVIGGSSIGNIAPSSIWVVSARGGEPAVVTDNEYFNVSPVWSPDGKSLLYISNQGGNLDVFQLPIGDSATPSGPPMRLTTGLNAHSISISSNGENLAYSVFTKHANIWSIPIPKEGSISISEAQPVTTGNQEIEGIDVSLDGQWIVFDSNLSGNQDIYKMRIGDGEPEQMTSHASNDFLPAWSPDGQEIAFYSFRNGNRDVFVMSADGGSLQQLTKDPAQERYPDWAPDGKQIVFYSDKTGRQELYLISKKNRLNWGEPRQLTFDGGMHGKWSPDGQLIVYVNNRRSLWVVSSNGGDPQLLFLSTDRAQTPAPEYPAWSSDGKMIYYKAYDAEGRSSFWAIPVIGGKTKSLVRFDDPYRRSSRKEFATDGKRLFFTMGSVESDIWVMDLITDE